MTKRVRFINQWTVTTKSDHKTLFVETEIRNANGRWCSLLLAMANMGGRFDEADLEHILEGSPDVLALQEGGDQSWVIRVAKKHGYRLVAKFGRPGQASTPTLIGPRVQLGMARWLELLGHVFIGKGAGPDWSKPKWINLNRLSVDGARFGASSWHLTASQQNRLRMVAAMREAATAVKALTRIRRPFFLLGDINSAFTQPLARWLLRHGMTSNHQELGEINTHGNRSIDAAICQRRLVKHR